MRVARAYADPTVVARVSKRSVELGQTVLQIFRLAETQEAHVCELLKYFDPPANAHILDVGCGVGGVADIMAAERPDLRFTLLNNSAEQLALCPSRFETLCADAHDIPLPNAGLDAVMICYALGHFDLEKAFGECSRVTKPGGLLFIYDLSGAVNHKMIDAFDYDIYSIPKIAAAAAQAGYPLYKSLVPEQTHIEHFYDKCPPHRCAELFAGISSVLFRFQKAAPIVKVSRMKKLRLLALSTLAPFA